MDNSIFETVEKTSKLSQQTSVKKLLHAIFVVDTSGSMAWNNNERIDAVNKAFSKIVPLMREAEEKANGEFELRISILSFNYYVNWLVKPTPISEYVPDTIECTEWNTLYSKAFEELNSKLTRAEFMSHDGYKLAVPYIMFMTDGIPSAKDDFGPALEKLNHNAWFTNSQRYAVLIGEDAINSESAKEAVRGFAGSDEGIVDAEGSEEILKVIEAVTMNTINATILNTNGEADGSSNGTGSSTGTGADNNSPFGGSADPDDPFGTLTNNTVFM